VRIGARADPIRRAAGLAGGASRIALREFAGRVRRLWPR
jgi:hypothetical protein